MDRYGQKISYMCIEIRRMYNMQKFPNGNDTKILFLKCMLISKQFIKALSNIYANIRLFRFYTFFTRVQLKFCCSLHSLNVFVKRSNKFYKSFNEGFLLKTPNVGVYVFQLF